MTRHTRELLGTAIGCHGVYGMLPLRPFYTHSAVLPVRSKGFQMSERRKDIEVQLTFLPREESGRYIPFYSGFRRQFHYDCGDWDALFDLGDIPFAQPGETVIAVLTFLSPDAHVGKLYPGKGFLLREGQRILGKGRVTRILELGSD